MNITICKKRFFALDFEVKEKKDLEYAFLTGRHLTLCTDRYEEILKDLDDCYEENKQDLNILLLNLYKLKENYHYDLIDYCICYVKYLIDMNCKKDSFKLLYSDKEILEVSEYLALKYENVYLRLLNADVYFDISEFPVKAANAYSDSHLNYCAYAQYRRAFALNLSLDKSEENLEYSIDLLKQAVWLNSKYFEQMKEDKVNSEVIERIKIWYESWRGNCRK